MGIKDTYILDHLDPSFEKTLAMKTKEKLAELKMAKPSYEVDGFITQTFKDEPQRHFYIEKYAGNANTRCMDKKRLPMVKSLAKIGPEG